MWFIDSFLEIKLSNFRSLAVYEFTIKVILIQPNVT